ncbi:hypothetical protein QYF36_018750 [Acer negundo]|nr:hypothetical protein QYF36_018750 [Acer negundo]
MLKSVEKILTGQRQSNRRKSKTPSSHGMKTRNSSNRVEEGEEDIKAVIARMEEEDKTINNAISGKVRGLEVLASSELVERGAKGDLVRRLVLNHKTSK